MTIKVGDRIPSATLEHMTADGPALRARKVAIVGSGGSGKSALARELGPAMGLDVYHLDAMFWKPGWVRTPKDEWRSTIEELVGRDSWLIDGNYAGTMEMRLAAADTIVFLDLPRTILYVARPEKDAAQIRTPQARYGA